MYIFDISILGFHIAPTWYWLMYALGFSFCYFFVWKYGTIKKNDLDTLLFYIFLWVIGWWRIGYVLFYNLSYFLEKPHEILFIWNWGMSFHGWFLGVLLATFIFAKKYKYTFFEITDILAVCLPVALGLGRIWNYINNELPWYAPYYGPFPMIIDQIPHFPNPLLEMLLEWIILFAIQYSIFRYSWLHKNQWSMSILFLLWYSSSRLISESFRLPDAHIWYLFGTHWITLGIIYTIPMFMIGIILLIRKYKRL